MFNNAQLTIADNPYRNDNAKMLTLSLGSYELWIDAATGRPIQLGLTTFPETSTAKKEKRNIREFRAMARTWAIATVGGDDKLSRLHPLEDNRRSEIFYFRWDDFDMPVSEDEIPPFIQIAFRADGTITSFTDTLKH